MKSQSNQLELSETALFKASMVTKKKRFNFLEKDLHPFLTYYAYYHFYIVIPKQLTTQNPQKKNLVSECTRI